MMMDVQFRTIEVTEAVVLSPTETVVAPVQVFIPRGSQVMSYGFQSGAHPALTGAYYDTSNQSTPHDVYFLELAFPPSVNEEANVDIRLILLVLPFEPWTP